MSEYLIQETTLKEIADAIRNKTGKSNLIKIQDVAKKIEEIPTTIDYINTMVTTIPDYAYSYNMNLRSVYFSNATTIGKYAFSTYDSANNVNIIESVLEYADFPIVTNINNYAFYNCENLLSINLAEVKSIGIMAFSNCVSLKSVTFPKANYFYARAFYHCSSLEEVVLESSIYRPIFENSVFEGCSNLHTIVIKYDGDCPLQSSNIFENTPIDAGNGSIYVLDNLVEQYKTDSYWSTYASQIKPLSEYTGTI